MALIIVCNAVAIGVHVEQMLSGDRDEGDVGSRVTEVIVCIIFTAELLARMYVYRTSFIVSSKDWRWNLFDTVIVIHALFTEFVMLFFGGGGEVTSVSVLRVVRVLKLA